MEAACPGCRDQSHDPRLLGARLSLRNILFICDNMSTVILDLLRKGSVWHKTERGFDVQQHILAVAFLRSTL